MKLENSFQVPAPPDAVWTYLNDVEKVIPCMPGAELTEVVDETTWKGKVRMTLGPVSLAYAGTVHVEERDDASRTMKMRAKGTEASGKGMASATVTSVVTGSDGGSRVEIVTDLMITGAAAQFGRGMVADVSQRFTDEFAACLSQRMAAPEGEGAEGEAGAAPAAKPISGIRLGLWALWRAIVRFFRRIWNALTGGGGEG
jgi:carbon monoxide dehydrogenase subunit G